MTIKKSQIEKWIAAQKRHRLSDTHVQMARELGLNPDKLGKIDNHRQEPVSYTHLTLPTNSRV